MENHILMTHCALGFGVMQKPSINYLSVHDRRTYTEVVGQEGILQRVLSRTLGKSPLTSLWRDPGPRFHACFSPAALSTWWAR